MTAQFLTRDPLDAVTRAAYGYASGDPLDLSDPTGLWGWNPFQDVGQAWHDTLGQHWRGVTQVFTVAAAGLGTAACLAATDGLCALALPEIGGVTSAALYGEGGDKHTLGGYVMSFAEGGIGGSLALICVAGPCEIAGSVVAGGALVT